jgi:molybdopterin converting factor subunit 1
VNIRLLSFGYSRDITGSREQHLTLPDGARISDLRDRLSAQTGKGERIASCAVAVNLRYADNDTVLKEGDEVALIPPVSGG